MRDAHLKSVCPFTEHGGGACSQNRCRLQSLVQCFGCEARWADQRWVKVVEAISNAPRDGEPSWGFFVSVAKRLADDEHGLFRIRCEAQPVRGGNGTRGREDESESAIRHCLVVATLVVDELLRLWREEGQ